jgi:hypothetical protein
MRGLKNNIYKQTEQKDRARDDDNKKMKCEIQVAAK